MPLCLCVLGLPKEAAKVLSTAGGPRENPIVTSQSWGHNTTLCLVAWVPLSIMDHPKTKAEKMNLHIMRLTQSSSVRCNIKEIKDKN